MAAYNIMYALTTYGVIIDTNNIIFDNYNEPQRISGKVLNDSFNNCIGMNFSEIDDNWKTYSSLFDAEGPDRLKPGKKVNIKALIRWVRDRICLYYDSITFIFPVRDLNDLIERYNTHKQ